MGIREGQAGCEIPGDSISRTSEMEDGPLHLVFS